MKDACQLLNNGQNVQEPRRWRGQTMIVVPKPGHKKNQYTTMNDELLVFCQLHHH
jgi:hypothetical protein